MWCILVTLSYAVALVLGHGRVLSPPGRGSLWRAGFSVPANYDDDGLNCGGFYHQYSVNGGKCGICGDPYDASEPRPHELGGIYGYGIISATYESSSIFTATVQISAYHKGFWEFKICPDPYNNEQECFEDYVLELEDGGTKYYPTMSGTYNVNYKLPEGLVCEHCVLQWRYTAGNNWGVCANGTQGTGCGDQEQFGACSDIAITGGSGGSGFIEVQNIVENILKNNEIGFIQLLINGAIRPHGWVQATEKPTTEKPKLTKPKLTKPKRKTKHKRKKVKPYKRKLARSKLRNRWKLIKK